jgi:Tol biopolymer transport system component
MLTKGGAGRPGVPQAKLMDFGLARATGLAPVAGTLTESPTASRALTAEGTIVGTFQYMAPEQLEGKDADARSDLWALGCVLYEMATGKRPFEGTSQASLIAAILKEAPRPMVELQPLTPPALERVARQCLEKDPDERWQSARDVASELRWISESGAEVISPSLSSRRARMPRERVAWLVAGVAVVTALALAAASVAIWRGAHGPVGEASLHATILHDGEGVIDTTPSNVAISPDGRRIAYIVNEADGVRLWVRDLESGTSRRLSDLASAQFPFWSPDGQWVAFFTEADPPRLWKAPANGGAPISLCRTTAGAGGTWSQDDVIVFAPTAAGPLHRVPASGGSSEPVTALDATRHETGHRMPWFLPDGDHFLFSTLPRAGPDVEIFAGSLRSKQVKRIMSASSGVTYAEPGYLLFERDRKLVAQRFDPSRLELTGEPVPIGDPSLAEAQWEATWMATASRDGRLASLMSWPGRTEVEWVDRSGRRLGQVPLPTDRWQELALAPDGRSVLAGRPVSALGGEVWLFDSDGAKAERVSPREIINFGPVWAPDGNSFIYTSASSGRFEIYRQATDHAGAPQIIPTVDTQFKTALGFTSDGRTLVFAAYGPDWGWDLWTAPLRGGGAPVLLVRAIGRNPQAAVSSDGRWLAYASDESGQSEIYVTSFPAVGQRTRVSTSGGAVPVWTRGGKELLYVASRGRESTLMSVAVEAGPPLIAGAPRSILTRRGLVSFAATQDGERLLLSVESGDTPPPYIGLTLNWTAALKGR